MVRVSRTHNRSESRMYPTVVPTRAPTTFAAFRAFVRKVNRLCQMNEYLYFSKAFMIRPYSARCQGKNSVPQPHLMTPRCFLIKRCDCLAPRLRVAATPDRFAPPNRRQRLHFVKKPDGRDLESIVWCDWQIILSGTIPNGYKFIACNPNHGIYFAILNCQRIRYQPANDGIKMGSSKEPAAIEAAGAMTTRPFDRLPINTDKRRHHYANFYFF